MVGAGIVSGPRVGASFVGLLPEFLSGLAEYRLLCVGALLLIVLRLAPEGVVGAAMRFFYKPDLRKARPGDGDIDAFLAERRAGRELQVQGLRVSFGGVHAVAGVSFTARPDRNSVEPGTSGSVRVDPGCWRTIKKKKH